MYIPRYLYVNKKTDTMFTNMSVFNITFIKINFFGQVIKFNSLSYTNFYILGDV